MRLGADRLAFGYGRRTVGSEVSLVVEAGRVTALLVKPGDRVKVGQALVELSSQVVGQLQADALKTQQDLGLAQKAIERGRKLMVDGAISAKELAQLEADVRKATSDAARAAAQLRSLGVSASEPAVNVALRARVDGMVVERSALVGQEVRADSTEPLLTISELGTVWVLADAYEQDLGLVQVGATVSVRVPAYPGETFAGKVVHVHDTVDPDTRTVKVRCVLPNPGGRLKPEMFAKVELSSQGGPHAIVLPSSAVLNDGDQSIVMVVNEDHSFQSAKVDVGPELGGKVRILSGLVAGQRVVTQGALFLQREQAVLRVAVAVQARINAHLGRPAPQRAFDSADIDLHNRLQGALSRRLPYLPDELESLFGLAVHVTADGIEIETREHDATAAAPAHHPDSADMGSADGRATGT